MTPGGVTLRFQASTRDDDLSAGPLEQPIWVTPRQDLGGAIRAGLSVTDDRGRRYRLRQGAWQAAAGGLGQPVTWDGEMRAEPVAGPQDSGATMSPAVRWLDFTVASSPAVRVVMPRPAEVETGQAEPPWPTPAECYLAALAEVTSMTIGTDGQTVELDTEQITAAVAEALLWAGALPPDSALLHGRGTAPGWQRALMHHWGHRAYLRARDVGQDRAVAPEANRIRVIVSTLREAAWADIDIPGR